MTGAARSTGVHVRRIAANLTQAATTAVVVVVASFLLVRLVPGDPVTGILGTRATVESSRELRHELHLDEPLYRQAGSWFVGILHGDLGQSLGHQGMSVWQLIGPTIPVTLSVAALGMALSVLLGVLVGVFTAWQRSRAVDLFVRVTAVLSLATPPFLVALLLVLVFAIRLEWLPAGGWGNGLGEPQYLVLPAVTTAIFLTPVIMRTARQAALGAVGEASVEAARARGIPPRRIVLRHVLPNSLLPVLSVVGLNAGAVLTVTVVVESVLGVPGLGSRLLDAVSTRDYPVIQAVALLTALFVVGINLAVDVLYGLLDPRLRRTV